MTDNGNGLVVLLARQRSGTGALGSILDQQKDIKYLGEVFHDDAVDKEPNYFWFLQKLVAEDARLALPGSAGPRLDRYAEYLKTYSNRRLLVLDIKYRSTHHFDSYWQGLCERPGLLHLLEKRNVPILHLTRRNFLKSYVSGRLADANKVWHARTQDQVVHRTLHVDPKGVLGFLRSQSFEAERMFHFLGQYPRQLTFDYADLFGLDGHLSAGLSGRICKLLDVERLEPRPPVFVKQTPDDLSSVIDNFDELADALAPSPYAWMLYSN